MAEALCEQGADLVIFGSGASVYKAAEEIQAAGKGSVHGLILDLGDAAQIEPAFRKALELLGGIDIMLNCAGINIRHAAEDFTLEDWDKVLNVNLKATFILCQLAGREMIPQRSGKIINVASINAYVGGYNNLAYSASKGGVGQLTKTLSNEWAKYGVNVNAIAPGYFHTQMNDYYWTTEEGAQLREFMNTKIPMGRWGEPEDLKGAAVFLASDASNYVSGIVLPVEGGLLGR